MATLNTRVVVKLYQMRKRVNEEPVPIMLPLRSVPVMGDWHLVGYFVPGWLKLLPSTGE
jgi:hypothetical protein